MKNHIQLSARNITILGQYLIIFSHKNLWKEVKSAFATLTFLYSSYKIFKEMYSNAIPTIPFSLWQTATVFVISFLWWSCLDFIRLNRKIFPIKNQMRSIAVCVGDMLSKTDGAILVGVNNKLDCENINPNSIQQQLINRYGVAWMKASFDKARRGENGESVANPDRIYPFGYTFTGTPDGGKHTYVFIVMSKSNEVGVPYADEKDIMHLLEELFSKTGCFARTIGSNCKNRTLYMPLLGAATAPIQKSKQQYAEDIARRFIREGRHCGLQNLIIMFRPHTLLTKNFEYTTLKETLGACSKLCSSCIS